MNQWFERKRKLFIAIGFVFASVFIGTLVDTRMFLNDATRWLVTYSTNTAADQYLIQNSIEAGCVITGLIWGYILYRPEVHKFYKEKGVKQCKK